MSAVENAAVFKCDTLTVSDAQRAAIEQIVGKDSEQNEFATMVRHVMQIVEQRGAFVIVEEDGELSPTKAAEFLKVSRPTVMSFIKKGKLECRKVGSHYRIPVSALLEFKKAQDAGNKFTAEALSQPQHLSVEDKPLTAEQIDFARSLFNEE
ncbi:helix-turn-helix domain-containing protein [Corynebacterium aquilae]|uniref:helix-turn-helix domain-containing protein n=1 Tax=Corynebacterium aquilae TaxID=203263 RepID=UPI0009519292|nr:helix-turn-helix domain-containing protein [Corynebacterium aquilae]